jgi:hypothetical protein
VWSGKGAEVMPFVGIFPAFVGLWRTKRHGVLPPPSTGGAPSSLPAPARSYALARVNAGRGRLFSRVRGADSEPIVVRGREDAPSDAMDGCRA